MKQLYYIRHGQSEFNKSLTWAGSSDTPLSELGLEQALIAGQKMKAEGLQFDAVISSPLERALHTAQIVCKEIGFPTDDIIIRADLVERDFGVLEGNKKLVAATMYMVDESAIDSYDGVESLAELQKRADAFWEYLQKLTEGRVLIVGHGAFGRALRRSINQQDLKHRGIAFHNAEYERLT